MKNGKADEEGLVDVIHHHHGSPTHLRTNHSLPQFIKFSTDLLLMFRLILLTRSRTSDSRHKTRHNTIVYPHSFNTYLSTRPTTLHYASTSYAYLLTCVICLIPVYRSCNLLSSIIPRSHSYPVMHPMSYVSPVGHQIPPGVWTLSSPNVSPVYLSRCFHAIRRHLTTQSGSEALVLVDSGQIMAWPT
jgi:hypothetical protein